ncbi:Thioredoxin [Carpediemonas membranifera]|uniref:Thioredoxin n=1 Tax=Carpediemonas membranifera TaxID=201153 RepID=A0A8J6AYU6_9EUKA|nr:Thioredoxin [Carpediemonas membranifera]|eukprot:KAG9394770.1 Thioredoxin [Carpediemonas membranifera]
MNTRVLSIAVLLILVASAFCKVVDLNESNFDAEVAKCDVSLVTFFAPWCGHCKRWHEPYEELSTRFADDNKICAFLVDVTENRELSGRYGIRGIPTIIAFHGDSNTKYEGARTPDAVYDWVTKL